MTFSEFGRPYIGLAVEDSKGETVGRPRINGMTVLKVKRLRDEGLSIRAIAKETGVSIGKVSSIVQKGSLL